MTVATIKSATDRFNAAIAPGTPESEADALKARWTRLVATAEANGLSMTALASIGEDHVFPGTYSGADLSERLARFEGYVATI